MEDGGPLDIGGANEDHDETELQTKIDLARLMLSNNGKSVIRRRNNPAIVRSWAYDVNKEPLDFYLARLQLYFPGSREDADLLMKNTKQPDLQRSSKHF